VLICYTTFRSSQWKKQETTHAIHKCAVRHVAEGGIFQNPLCAKASVNKMKFSLDVKFKRQCGCCFIQYLFNNPYLLSEVTNGHNSVTI
jgi:hypothetical protein